MANPTRYNRVGLSGPPGPTNQTDAFIEIITVPLPLVASTDEQFTGIFLPPRCWVFTGLLNTIESAEGSGLTISVGDVLNGPGSFISDANSNDSPSFGWGSSQQFADGSEITYTLGAADWTAWRGEMILYVIGSMMPTEVPE